MMVALKDRVSPVLLTAFVLRILYILVAQTYIFPINYGSPLSVAPTHLTHYFFGFETGAIAESLAKGEGFGSPFGGSTGPTAWMSPLYPALCAMVFKVFGIYSAASAFVILAINSLFSALTCWTILEISKRTVGNAAGQIAAWTWAVVPFFMRWPVTWVWDTALSAFLLSLAVIRMLDLAEQNETKHWVWAGVLWGVIALTNPALLSTLPLCILWVLWKRKEFTVVALVKPAITCFILLLVISPWLARNRVAFGKWVFLRDNLPFELNFENFHTSNGMGWPGRHPSGNTREFMKYKTLGELAYMTECKKEFDAFVQNDRATFIELSEKRVWYWWYGTYFEYEPGNSSTSILVYFSLTVLAGLGMMRALFGKVPGAGLLAAIIFVYPIPYYVTNPMPRFRYAIEPFMLMLAAYFVVSLFHAAQSMKARTS